MPVLPGLLTAWFLCALWTFSPAPETLQSTGLPSWGGNRVVVGQERSWVAPQDAPSRGLGFFYHLFSWMPSRFMLMGNWLSAVAWGRCPSPLRCVRK